MSLPPSFLFHLLNETRNNCTPRPPASTEPASGGQPPNVHTLGFSTSNYDAMLKFFRDFGFSIIEDPHDQLTPFFEHGRASRISRGDFEFQLEESKSRKAKACFNLFLDLSDNEIEKVKSQGYKFDYAESLCGSFHTFYSPDGGVIVA